ncbi:putative carboxypeptidase [Aspergillus campestris IBT 28561]|uniref:Carboxypeptidase n=1 Tax=Aspergillus campestris (strain IBT 28561) TaxID=1392248 RepID=A0A2I1D2E7_ASPC2|nr:putative carboxypeptidase [Aspergillus campestris IBT 28561]PKY04037.1 putative carboxypeptidase [Aspergillus campestris IBT 28561]
MKLSSTLLLTATGLSAASPHPAPPRQLHLAVQDDAPLLESLPSVTDSLDDVINASPFLSFHRGLVQTSSVSNDEQNAGSFVAEFLESHNFTVIKQPVGNDDFTTNTQGRFNIFAYPPASPSPQILLTSHIDTVPPFIPYSLSHPSNDSSSPTTIRIAGRGSVDAKASVAAQVFAALDILESNPTAPLALLFVVGEEVGGDGMRAFSDSPSLNPSPSPFTTVIFGEPTDLALVSGHKGMLGFQVVANGHAAHSGYPWLGRSAVSAILPALSIVDKLGSLPDGLPPSPKYGPTTVNIGRVDAGVATNVVPAKAVADVAVRLAAGTPDEAREIIRRAVRDATAGDEDVVVDFASHDEAYPPQDLDTDVPGFDIITVNYGTDVPNLRIPEREDGRSVRRYLYGPGSIHVAHGDNEALTVGDLESALQGYRRLVEAALER